MSRLKSLVEFLFKRRTNKVLCGATCGALIIGLVISHQWHALHANEHNVGFSGDTVKLVALMLIPLCVILLGLSERKFSISFGMTQLSVGQESPANGPESEPYEEEPRHMADQEPSSSPESPD